MRRSGTSPSLPNGTIDESRGRDRLLDPRSVPAAETRLRGPFRRRFVRSSSVSPSCARRRGSRGVGGSRDRTSRVRGCGRSWRRSVSASRCCRVGRTWVVSACSLVSVVSVENGAGSGWADRWLSHVRVRIRPTCTPTKTPVCNKRWVWTGPASVSSRPGRGVRSTGGRIDARCSANLQPCS